MAKVELNGTLPIGAFYGGEEQKEYTLLRSNGIAEKVYTDRLNEKPYTWIGNVLTVGLDRLGTYKIGVIARKHYSQSEEVLIPEIVKALPLSAANVLLIELHRKTWQRVIKDQEGFCKYCGHKNIIDIDMDKLGMTEADKEKLKTRQMWNEIDCILPYGYTYQAKEIFGGGKDDKYMADHDGKTYNCFTFRTPTLGDAIALESLAGDPLVFWRRLALATLIRVTAVGEIEGKMVPTGDELPIEAIHTTGMRLFDEYLDREDLKAIRSALRDVPTIGFDYLIECQNKACRHETPIILEGSELFSF